MKILFLASEVAPFVKTGGLGDVAKALPAALARQGHDVMVVTPRYASIPANDLRRLDASVRLRFPFGEERAGLLSADLGERHEVVFLNHPGFYGRPGIYGDAWGEYPDNHRRFAFFAIGALSAAEVLGFEPDIVHLNDWQCGLAPLALKRGYAHARLGRAKTVFTIHNLAYQGLFPKDVIDDLGLSWSEFTREGFEFHDALSFMKSALAYSDAWTTVSEKYAQEIQTPELGCDLDGFIKSHAHKLTGILNGVDYAEWDPSNDPHLPARYSADDFAGKEACKRALKERVGIPERGTPRPLFGMVTRLAHQKGLDVLLNALPAFLERDQADFVLLGSGEARYENAFRTLARRHPNRVGVYLGFDVPLSHAVEAGSDFFLMPSLYEPCGLNQMYSLRYGTPPIVHATGGLDDTIIDADSPGGNGFKFREYDARALTWSMDRARELFRRPDELLQLRKTGMAASFSWDVAAEKYGRLYTKLAGANG